MHLSVLGDVQQWIQAETAHGAESDSSITMNTRILPPNPSLPPEIPPEPHQTPAPILPPPEPAKTPAATDTTAVATPQETPPDTPTTAEPLTEITEPPPLAAPTAAEGTNDTAPTPQFSFPGSTSLSYEVQFHNGGNKVPASAELMWSHDGTNYQASLKITKFAFTLLQWTSHGTLTDNGLAPLRFGDKRRNSSEVAAHFVRDQGTIIFSANTPPAPLQPGAQDTLSVVLQLASMWAAAPQRHSAGPPLTLQVAEARHADNWGFAIAPEEHVEIDGRTLPTIKLTREATLRYDTTIELWLAPEISYLPARLRLTKTNGEVLDLLWTGKQPT